MSSENGSSVSNLTESYIAAKKALDAMAEKLQAEREGELTRLKADVEASKAGYESAKERLAELLKLSGLPEQVEGYKQKTRAGVSAQVPETRKKAVQLRAYIKRGEQALHANHWLTKSELMEAMAAPEAGTDWETSSKERATSVISSQLESMQWVVVGGKVGIAAGLPVHVSPSAPFEGCNET
jgi:hypothetical protein